MKETQINYLKLRRKYRIEVSNNLMEFWNRVEPEKIAEKITRYYFYELRILSIQQVIDFNVKKIRTWFKEKATFKYVKYWIPLAEVVNSESIFIYGLDQRRKYLGVYLLNVRSEPVFIADDFQLLLSYENSEFEFGDDITYLKEKVLDQFLFEYHFECEIDSFINFMKTALSKILWGNELSFVKNEVSIICTFKENEFEKSIKVEVSKYLDEDTLITIIDFVNAYIWSSTSILINYYGFYMTKAGLAFLYHDELIEFVRKGLIPMYYNAKLPSCLYIDRVNDYVDEPLSKRDQELMSMTLGQAWEHIEKAGLTTSIRRLKNKDIPAVLDYYYDCGNEDLVLDGIDELKIKSEPTFLKELEVLIQDENSLKKRRYLTWLINEDVKGHAYYESLNDSNIIQFQFYFRDMSWEDEIISDKLFNASIQYIISHLKPDSILIKVNKDDAVRIGIVSRNGFEQVLVETSVINEIGLEQALFVFEKDCLKNS